MRLEKLVQTAAKVVLGSVVLGAAVFGLRHTAWAGENIAYQKPVTVGSTESAEYAGSNAVDANGNTRWSSAYADNQNFVVDLQQNRTVSSVKIAWEAAYASQYQIQVSTDRVSWTTVYSNYNGTGGTETITFNPVNARYVKLYCIKRATQYGFSLYEFEVYQPENTAPAATGTENLAYGKTVTVASTESAEYAGSNAVDADGNTRWSSSYADNQNFVVDLGSNQQVSRVKIAWEAAYASQYQIQVSTDRVSWTTVYSNYNGKGGTETITFNPVNARYVKLYCIKRATQYGFSLYEFEIYGPQTNSSNALTGKTLFFLGSSVTYGYASGGVSFVDYLAQRNNCTTVKEAVSGTTLVNSGSDSYVQRMLHNLSTTAHCDHFICQLSTNDASQGKPMGQVSSSYNLNDFNTSTVIGAMEYIICYAKQTWNCPVSFYTGVYYSNSQYQQMVDALYQLQSKWGIGIIDLWNNSSMRNVSSADYARYMSDSVHPTAAGYLEWWTPVFEAYFQEHM